MLLVQLIILECCGNNVASLLPAETKFLNGSNIQELLDTILLPVGLALFKIPGHSKIDYLKAKGNHLANTSTRNAVLKKDQQSLSWSKGLFFQMITLKNWLKKPNDWPQRRKNKTGNPTIVGLIKRISSGSG